MEKMKIKWEIKNFTDDTMLLYLQVSTNFGADSKTIDSVQAKKGIVYWDANQKSSDHCVLRLVDSKDEDKIKIKGESKRFTIEENIGDNYAIISAIKSIAGIKPSLEFFDINLNFRFTKNLFVLVTGDVAMTNDKDTSKDTKKFTEGTISLMWSPFKFCQYSCRQIVVSPFLKIFNTIPYVGLQICMVEPDGKLI